MIMSASYSRETRETQISVEICLLSCNETDVDTGVPFFDHMLGAMAAVGRFNLAIKGQGDLGTGGHHLVEDTGLCLGQALRELAKGLASGPGLHRYGNAVIPMDDALVAVTLDLSGRAYLNWQAAPDYREFGLYNTDLTAEFLQGLCRGAGLTCHARLICGSDAHHITEATYKALGAALKQALEPLPAGAVTSTKGVLDL